MCVCGGGGGGGGGGGTLIFLHTWARAPRDGGTLNFSSYVGSSPAFTLHPKKYQEFRAPQKIFEILATQKYIPILYNDNSIQYNSSKGCHSGYAEFLA